MDLDSDYVLQTTVLTRFNVVISNELGDITFKVFSSCNTQSGDLGEMVLHNLCSFPSYL